jgi:hypothetical protein
LKKLEKYDNGGLEVKAKKKGGFSKYFIFDGLKDDFQIKYTDFQEGDPKAFSEETTRKIQSLRVWSRQFFSEHSSFK